MPEKLLSVDPFKAVYIRPDEDGFTTRTVHYDTQQVLDANARRRSMDPKPRVVTKDGVGYTHVGSIPKHVLHTWIQECGGRWPTHDFLLKKLRERDFSKLRMTEERF